MAQYNTPWWKRFLGHLLLPGLYSWFQKDTEGKSGWQNFKENISGMVSDSGVGNYVKSAADTLTGAHLTGSQVEANEMQMQNAEDIFGRQVAGMQKAGLNPALMYDNGIGSAPAVQGSQGTGSMSDLMSLIMLPLNKKLLQAQISNVKADTRGKIAGAEGQEITNTNLDAQMKAAIASSLANTDSTKSETLYRNLLIQYGMPEAEVNKVLNDVKVGDSVVSRNEAEVELARVNAAYAEVKKKIDLDKLPYEIASMSASAREARARAVVEEFRAAYMTLNNTDVPSGAIASFVGLISNLFHGLNNDAESGQSGWNELNYRTLFPFIDMILSAFGK